MFLSCFHFTARVEFIPTNRTDYFVLKVLIKPGKADEIYSDRENKVSQ